MLVLSRKIDQQIAIGTDVSITVLEIVGKRVELGIAAPDTQQVLRGELVAQRAPTTASTYRPAVGTPIAIRNS